MENKLLFRVWLGWSDEGSGNRDEVMRVLANTRDEVIDYAKKQILKPEYHEDSSEWGDDVHGGIEWDEGIEECGCEPDDPLECVCHTHWYIDVEEIKDYKEDDLSLKLLTPSLGTINMYRDMCGDKDGDD